MGEKVWYKTLWKNKNSEVKVWKLRPDTKGEATSAGAPKKKTSRSGVTSRGKSVTPRRKPVTPRKKPVTPRKEPVTPRKDLVTPRKDLVTPRKKLVTPRKKPVSPRKKKPICKIRLSLPFFSFFSFLFFHLLVFECVASINFHVKGILRNTCAVSLASHRAASTT